MTRGWAGVAVAAILLAGCAAPEPAPTPLSPASYRSARDTMGRSVGLLRRLAVLQVHQDAPPACGGHDATAHAVPLDDAVRALLVERKGYELVVPATDGPLPPDDLRRLAEAEGGASPALLARLAQWRQDARIDGLLLVASRDTCANALPGFRPAMAVFSLGVSEWLPSPELRQIVVARRAVIVESLHGRVVWRAAHNPLDLVAALGSLGQVLSTPTSPAERLFETLETAVPAVLVR